MTEITTEAHDEEPRPHEEESEPHEAEPEVTITMASRVPWITTAAVAVVAVLGLIFPISQPSASSATPVGSVVDAAFTSSESTNLTDVSALAAQAVDSVVEINVALRSRGPFSSRGSGSGVIVDTDGTIVTNAHVVRNATEVEVELNNGLTYRGEVLAIDPPRDLAVVKIDAEGLTAVELGSSNDLAVGQPVIAIGNPLALDGGPSVSTGIVSALDRNVRGDNEALNGVIQTDAAITQGSSGGALLDAQGRLIGITTAVGVSRIGIEGIGFAVPVESVRDILSEVTGA